MTAFRKAAEAEPAVKFEAARSTAINSTSDYRRHLFEYASSLVDQEVEALESLNHLSAIKKVSELLRLNPSHLTLYLEVGEEEFERVFNYAVRFEKLTNESTKCNCP